MTDDNWVKKFEMACKAASSMLREYDATLDRLRKDNHRLYTEGRRSPHPDPRSWYGHGQDDDREPNARQRARRLRRGLPPHAGQTTAAQRRARCHNRYDADHRRETRARTRREATEAAGQTTMKMSEVGNV